MKEEYPSYDDFCAVCNHSRADYAMGECHHWVSEFVEQCRCTGFVERDD